MGVLLQKMPEDLRIYEHLLWMAQPDVVVEVGAHDGGSTLWFRDRLRTLGHYTGGQQRRVISIDIDMSTARREVARADPRWDADIVLLEGDVRDPALVQRVSDAIPAGARCLVVEDSAHEYDTTLAALRAFAHLVAVGSFFVVEDTCVDVPALRVHRGWPRGVLPALRDWLATDDGSAFRPRRDLELYGLTCNPHGILERTR